MNARDEVCGMEFAKELAVASLQFQDMTYYFCAERCRSLFEQHPDWYVPVREARGRREEDQSGSSE